MTKASLLLAMVVCGALLTSCGDDGPGTAANEAVDQLADKGADDGGEEGAEGDDAEGDDVEEADDAAPETGDNEGSNVVEVSLVEWTVDAQTEIESGTVSFAVTNNGLFDHKFGVARGDGYEALPRLDNGAIDEDALGADFIGEVEPIAMGDSITVDYDLEPGNYVLFCNIFIGPNSHAAAGQVLSVTAV